MSATPRSVPDRILHSAMEVISDFGVRRFTVDELARRVGLSRVTIYRHFDSRSEVLAAALLHELEGFLDEVAAAVIAEPDPPRRLVAGLVMAVRRLGEHAVLQRLLRTEPEVILPLLTLEAGPVLLAGRELIGELLGPDTEADPRASVGPKRAVLEETLARLVLSLVLTPLPDERLEGFVAASAGALLDA